MAMTEIEELLDSLRSIAHPKAMRVVMTAEECRALLRYIDALRSALSASVLTALSKPAEPSSVKPIERDFINGQLAEAHRENERKNESLCDYPGCRHPAVIGYKRRRVEGFAWLCACHANAAVNFEDLSAMNLYHPIPDDIKALAHKDAACRACAFECLISELIRAIDDSGVNVWHGPAARNLIEVRDYASEFKHNLFVEECYDD